MMKQGNSLPVPQQTPEGTAFSLNNEDRNPLIANTQSEDQIAPVVLILIHSQSTPSPDTQRSRRRDQHLLHTIVRQAIKLSYHYKPR